MIDAIWSNWFRSVNKTIIDLLRGVPVFDGLSDGELKKVARYMVTRKFVEGEYVFSQREPGAGMYMVLVGRVKIILESPTEDTKELALLGEGDFFGEMALLDESARSASAVATTEKLELLSFFRGDLLKLVQEYPDIASKVLWNIGTVLSDRLRKNNELYFETCKRIPQ